MPIRIHNATVFKITSKLLERFVCLDILIVNNYNILPWVLNAQLLFWPRVLFIQCIRAKTQSMAPNPRSLLFVSSFRVVRRNNSILSLVHWKMLVLVIIIADAHVPIGDQLLLYTVRKLMSGSLSLYWPGMCTTTWWAVHDNFQNMAVCVGNFFPRNSGNVLEMWPKAMSRFLTVNLEANEVVKYPG